MLFLILPLLFLPLFAPTIHTLNQDGLFLQQVKLGLSDPTNALSDWNPRDDTPCSWSGITCNPPNHHVINVDLSNFQLSGPFPTFLCHLPNLTFISLFNNNINSSLSPSFFTPSSFSPCPNLQYLNLSSNLLVGPLPETLTNLPNLRVLDLSYNNFSGKIPAKFGEFPQLETLSLYGNLLQGTIPSELGNISSLIELSLAYNYFDSQELPTQLSNLTNLEVLWLSGCSLIGTIPEQFRKLTKLRNIDLSYNKLGGSFPAWITELVEVIQVELYNNSLTGELPTGFSNLTKLRRLDASTNFLTGMIPTELCLLELESLNLFENSIVGTLPESIAESPNLTDLKLYKNNLSGVLPTHLGLNSPLTNLDLSGNNFSGEIPEGLCVKGSLKDLVLMENSFTGRIPGSLGNCPSLNRVRLRGNQLSGPVPDGLWGHPGVKLLELVGNSLSGEISRTISSAENLSELWISGNQFSGSIPMEVGLLRNLVDLSAGGNMFTGEIPGSLVNLSQLVNLDLSDNELTGGFPEGIQGWKSLNDLNLSGNQLSGSIPDEIGSLTVLNYLDLSNNRFWGKIPLGLEDLKLNLLNLSNNLLSGDIPPLFAKEMYKSSFLGNPGLCDHMEGLCPKTSKPNKAIYSWIFRSISVLAGLVFVAGVIWFCFKHLNFKKDKKGITMTKWTSFHKLGFSELEIVDCLNENNLIGSGASGKVYKVVLNNGETVAVKKLIETTKKQKVHCEYNKDQFEAEVETLGKIRHKNIVKLWCSCDTSDSKLLVYEYMPNGSLGDLLHSSKGGLILDWPTRNKIALDAAEGLSYLHHDCVPSIVHRDVKSNNILLDADFVARVADFGVAKVVSEVENGTESMSIIAGSCGYIAPEYAYTLRVNEKSDIYSFGIVLLELVTGRRPIDPEFGEKDLVKWVCNTLDQQGLDNVIDHNLDFSHKDEIARVLDVGLRCTLTLPINRPSMRKVVKLLQEAYGDAKEKIGKKDEKLSPYYDVCVSEKGV